MKGRSRRLLSALIVAAMLLSLLPTSAFAEGEPKGESVLLPVTDGVLMMPTNAIGLDDTPIYAAEDAYSVYLSGM